MVLAFQSERVAIAQVKKLAEGYLLSLQINNLLENKQEYSKTLPCRQCDEFDVQATLKKLVPMSAVLPPVVLPIMPVAPVTAPHRNTVVSARPAAEKAPQMLVADTLPKQRGRVGKRTTIAGMPFVWVSPGCFKMGFKKNRKGVCVDTGFWLGETEVTQEHWQQMMGVNPSANTACGADCPVESVSFMDVQQVRQLAVFCSPYAGNLFFVLAKLGLQLLFVGAVFFFQILGVVAELCL